MSRGLYLLVSACYLQVREKGVNTIHSFDQSIVCEERAECGLHSKSFPMSDLGLKIKESRSRPFHLEAKSISGIYSQKPT